jgi:hypothetical protein
MRRLARHGAVVAAHTTTLRPVTGCVATLKSGASSGDAGEPQTDTRRAWGRSAACPKAAAQTGVRGWRGLANDASTSGRAEVRGDVRGDVSSFVARLRADVLALWRGAEMTEAFLGEELHGPKLLKMLKLLAEPEQGGDGDHDQQLLTVRAFPGSCSRRVGGQAPSLSVSTRVGADVWGPGGTQSVFSWAVHNQCVTPTHSTLYVLATARAGRWQKAEVEVRRMRSHGRPANALVWCAVVAACEKVRTSAGERVGGHAGKVLDSRAEPAEV